ncbi:MAG: hypothetical protein WDZ80_08025 [Candidatus Paceibacterota bacterium]
MNILKTIFTKKRSRPRYRKNAIVEIKEILAEYSRKDISIVECVSNTAPLTVELIFMYSSGNTDKSVYNSILIMITNYFVMMYIEMYTGFYAVSRNHTCNMVSSMVDEVLKETAKKQNGLNLDDLQKDIHKSRDFTRQMVEVYYRTGIEDCHRYVTSSIYWVLLAQNRDLSVERDWVEHIVRSIQAEKFLAGNNNDAEFNLENTG